MDPELSSWLNLVFRWFHVVVGILWIGQTAFFSWLDTRMTIEADDEGNEQVWMVHSGGFYRVEKQKRPQVMPRSLHWFKWEAMFSWLSGIVLLLVVYHMGGLLVDTDPFADPADQRRTTLMASALGLGILLVAWVVYDLLWQSPLAKKQEALMTGISLALLVGAAWFLSQEFNGRAAYIHVGAIMGTIMTANVWMRILPAQRKMVEAVRSGGEPDLSLGLQAKFRSQHNTFLAVPLIFIMISNHFPTQSYGHRLNWLMLMGFLIVGFVVRALMNAWNRKPVG